ncbi:RNA-binding protein [Anaeroplasma bactoclasticum]|jgi:RNA-binding protein|uniref:RNA-binding protein n=1 Tax=Anaeroplasma bactoclasticum TaxID=2088 RepID=A0A397RTN1_9MOLU|nr:YhbY family RNA-binding protein [Anaeroplasma bactoclasticum]RIA75779.1 RNA-binding protein [Anaeroplasma bactoclasticum]
MLTTKQKVYLRSLAQKIKPVAQIGKEGLSDNLMETVLSYLKKHELMKISILQNSYVTFEEAEEFFRNEEIEFVQSIGRQIVLYKQSDDAIDPIKFPKK